MCLNKIKVTSVMIGRNPRYEIDIMIIQALEENTPLRYIDIQEKINLRCKRLGLKKPSTDTITNRLEILREKEVLQKEEGMYGCTHYSLKYHHHVTYIENVLSLRPFRRYVYPTYIKSDDQPIETIEEEKLAPPVTVLNQESEEKLPIVTIIGNGEGDAVADTIPAKVGSSLLPSSGYDTVQSQDKLKQENEDLVKQINQLKQEKQALQERLTYLENQRQGEEWSETQFCDINGKAAPIRCTVNCAKRKVVRVEIDTEYIKKKWREAREKQKEI
jgi:hypothetical protein